MLVIFANPKMNRKDQLLIWLEEKPEDAFLRFALALEWITEGNDENAEAIFAKLIEDESNYVATYYHYGALIERKGDEDGASKIYEKGMEICKQLKETHAFNELRSVWEELNY